MAIHTYKHTSKGWQRLKTIDTEAKARKSKGAVPSVTTVLDILKDPFLHGVWVPRQAVKLARETLLAPKGDFIAWKYAEEDIPQAIYGFRECPETGEMIPSSEFGTNAHNFMEEWAQSLIDGSDPSYETPYAGVCKDCIAKLEKIATPLYAELLVGSLEDESCGALDLVAEVDGKVELFDFKFKSLKGKTPNYSTYKKTNLTQLAIEAEWYKECKNLDYMPRINSVYVDCDTGRAYIKQWSEEDQAHGVQLFKDLRKVYANPLVNGF